MKKVHFTDGKVPENTTLTLHCGEGNATDKNAGLFLTSVAGEDFRVDNPEKVAAFIDEKIRFEGDQNKDEVGHTFVKEVKMTCKSEDVWNVHTTELS